ncbi:MAG TPA: tetratricopeptide repeat protein [Candidatus Limnocylindrales bacterium]|nr:tetratricopeptide repeat protein [Candidatus Limnocylindrales bacterium]
MKLPMKYGRYSFVAFLLLAFCGLVPAAFAQYGGGGGMQQQQQPPPSLKQQPQQQQPAITGVQPPGDAPKEDPEEQKAYKDFHNLKTDQVDQEIQLGEAFVQKYPTSKYTVIVYSRLVNGYFAKQQFDKMYAAADKALALNDKDVEVLTLVGWVIPHSYDPNDIEAERKLDKAEAYEKRALEALPTLEKPAEMSDADFAKAKTEQTSTAHSGLGLVYFRRQQFAESSKELEQAIQLASKPDSADLYVLGIDYMQMKRYSDAADCFQKCAAVPGGLSAPCKQKAEQAKKEAASQPASTK